MTITTENSTINYTGNGVTDIFAFDMKTFEETDIVAAIDAIEVLNIAVTLNLDQDVSPGGSVEFLDGPPAALTDVFIGRVVPKTQETDYRSFDPFPANSHEQALDKLTMLIQQQVNVFTNSIRVPLSDPTDISKLLPGPAERANQFIFFDDDGNVTLSFGTEEGDNVRGIVIAADSLSMLIADNLTNPDFPIIGVNNINGVAGLMKLTQVGDYPQFPGLPGGGLPIEVLSNTPFLLFAVPIDDGTLQPGTDSKEMLTSYRQSNPEGPFGFADVIGVNTPNQPLHLVQTDEFGQIPSDLIRYVGLRNRGIFRGDDLCDKPGDEPLECTVPDTRNPSERFPSLDFPPGTGTPGGSSWQAGDFFAVTMADGEADGTMNLFTDLGDAAPSIVTVEANDGIIFIPEVRDPEAPFDIIVQHGWYHQPGRFSLTTAALVSLNTAGYGFIIGLPNDDVQNAFNFIDAALAQFRADQVSFDSSGGTIMINPATDDVQRALLDLDQQAFPRSGGTIAGNMTIFSDDATLFVQPSNVDGNSNVRLRGSSGIARGTFTFIGANGGVAIQRFDVAGALECQINLIADGNIAVNGSAPTFATHLTRKDYVDGQVGVAIGIAEDAVTIAESAQSAAEAANVNANTRKPEQDFLRSGDRLDIFNVRTS